jgi:Polymer-forming cytoskeletal
MPTALLPHPVTGFSLRAELGDDERAWTPDLIASLDWMRVAELLRALAAESGWELGPSRVHINGAVQFAMVRYPRTIHESRVLVRLVGWNQWGATPDVVQDFVTELGRIREPTRGTLVAPDGFSPAAASRAQIVGIDAVDAEQLHRTLQTLRPEQADFFFSVSTAGASRVPTCPVCLRKLSRLEQPSTGAVRALPGEMIFQSSTLVPDPVICGQLEVMRHCEVTFLHEVRARELNVYGDVSGDFIVEGPCVLHPGATLTGTVCARAVKVHDGAELRGQFRILDGINEPMREAASKWYWRCLNDSGRDACRTVVFEPHG